MEEWGFGVQFEPLPEPLWEYAPTGDFLALHFRVLTAPNWFHRQMQRLILGIKWREISKNERAEI